MYQRSENTPVSSQSKVIDVSFTYAAEVEEPITLAEVKEYMRVDYDDDDTVITRLITFAREWAEKHAAITIVPRMVVAWLESVNRIELPYGPVTDAIADISVENSDGVTITGTRFIGNEYPRLLGNGLFTVSYNAGFTEVPEGLKIAMCAKVLSQFENRGDEWKDKYDGIAWSNLQPYRRVTWV